MEEFFHFCFAGAREKDQHSQFFLYRCKKCGKGYNNKEEYRGHMKDNHPLEKKHCCTDCGKMSANFTYTRQSTLAKSHMNAKTVDMLIVVKNCLYCIKKFILEKSHTYAKTVERPFFTKDLCQCIKKFILERSHTSAPTVRNALRRSMVVLFMKESIQERNHIVAKCVESAFLQSKEVRHMRGFTLRINPISARCVEMLLLLWGIYCDTR